MVGTITILSNEWKFILIPIALVVCILARRGDWRRIYPWVERGDIMTLPRNTINHPGLTYLCRRLEPNKVKILFALMKD